ncbi:hypothetical protein [Streptomyces sp. NPDC058773]|uniref:hypothetical protein n=1 Tax=Streptomyces sp. NPDC058773 TaxID=3346632 RepID=UPI0036B78B7A
MAGPVPMGIGVGVPGTTHPCTPSTLPRAPPQLLHIFGRIPMTPRSRCAVLDDRDVALSLAD